MVLLRHITAPSPADAVHYYSAVYRNTVRKYALAESPPLRKKKGVTGMPQTQRHAST